MLARVVCRARQANLLREVIVATSIEPTDDLIVSECKQLRVPVFRGDEQDVLDRYYQAAMAHKAEILVRITSDCPFIEPEVIDRVVRVFLSERPDYASNTLSPTYPRGLDTEVMAEAALARTWREAVEPYQRVHVTPYIYQNPGLFRLLSVRDESNHSNYRWTVDTREDLDFVRAVYARLVNEDTFNWRDVLKMLAQEPELMELNRHIRQKALEEG